MFCVHNVGSRDTREVIKMTHIPMTQSFQPFSLHTCVQSSYTLLWVGSYPMLCSIVSSTVDITGVSRAAHTVDCGPRRLVLLRAASLTSCVFLDQFLICCVLWFPQP